MDLRFGDSEVVESVDPGETWERDGRDAALKRDVWEDWCSGGSWGRSLSACNARQRFGVWDGSR